LKEEEEEEEEEILLAVKLDHRPPGYVKSGRWARFICDPIGSRERTRRKNHLIAEYTFRRRDHQQVANELAPESHRSSGHPAHMPVEDIF
jgi:hypothetical protein